MKPLCAIYRNALKKRLFKFAELFAVQRLHAAHRFRIHDGFCIEIRHFYAIIRIKPALARNQQTIIAEQQYRRIIAELIRHALEHGARRLILGLGGSATTDGGMGLAQVLGVAFLDADGKALAPGGGSLARLARIETDAIVPQAKDCTFILACDVRNQLCGTEGAAAVFGPQKGATPEQVALLDQALSRYASVLSSQLGSDAAQRDGAGAAGGIGCAMMAFFGASFLSGIDLVLDAAGFSTAVAGADLVLTGEGRLDAQSAYGKVPCGVARRAKAVRNVPVLAIGGALGDGAESLYSCGVDALASTVSRITTLESAMANAVASIEETTARTMRLLDAGRKMEQNKVS